MESRKQPTLYMLAGPNGAGKSTLYDMVVKRMTKAPFINANVIQRLEMKDPSMQASYEAARIAEGRRQEHLSKQKSFVSESTFSHPSKLKLIKDAKKVGFRVLMFHVSVGSPDLSVARVQTRVSQGGHNVPEDKIRQRYERNQPLIRQAVKAADIAFVYDNSKLRVMPSQVIQFKRGSIEWTASDVPVWVKVVYRHDLNLDKQGVVE